MKKGVSFGITSGIITTLGLMVGLNSGTHSVLVVIGGILTIAIADAFSDALGIHVSEESESRHTATEVWQSTGSAFAAKLLIAASFIVPVLLLPLDAAIIAGVVYGMVLLGLLSFYIARLGRKNPAGVVAEHVIIAFVVIAIANYVGGLIGAFFA
jgi:VIT1/CCC1 family predicted Fe2+/Mn2+ transporter